MNKVDIQNRINALNQYMLANSTKELLLLKTSSDYTYNKAIAIIDKNTKNKDWYSINRKTCFKSWNEIDAFIDGICIAKNTNFER